MPRTLLVTGCDSRYFPLMIGLYWSIEEAGGLGKVDLGFFDIDLDHEQRQWLERRFQRIVRPEPMIPMPAKWTVDRRYLTSLVRPWLPEYFPGYDIYLYSDVDVWIAEWCGFERFITAAASGTLCIVAEEHRAYRPSQHALSYRRYHYRRVFGAEGARRLMRVPYLNGGVFALAHAAPHWRRWQQHLASAIRDDSE